MREGFPSDRIHVTGNPIYEVLTFFESEIESSQILKTLSLQSKQYFLVTTHRAENIENKRRIANILRALEIIQNAYKLPIVVSTHPHTRTQIENFALKKNRDQMRFLEPLGFFDFIKLEKNATCVLSDSGTVQEECCIFKIPNVTLRDTTERPETIEAGSTILGGNDPEFIYQCVRVALERNSTWKIPAEYIIENVSTIAATILLGHISYA